MSRRSRNSGSGELVRICAYFALAISALTFLFNGIVACFEIPVLPKALGIVEVVGKACLLIGIAIPAYDFTCDKHVAWQIIYWIALVVFAAGCVFGLLPQLG